MLNGRNFTLDYLRGLAALMVCMWHFSPALPAVLLYFAEQGQLGVQVFFVISGYIIPYSLLKAGWRFTDMGRFWLKRLVRLHPAYATALLLTFGLSSLAAFSKGEPPKISWLELVQDFFYLGFPAENPVIWTLIVEIKYYFFISMFFPLVFSKHRNVRRISFCICAAMAALCTSYLDVLRYLPFFMLGFVACYVAMLRISEIEAALLVLLTGAAALAKSAYPELAAGLLCYLAIRHLPPMHFKLGIFLGAISYSLYLIHFPLGVKLLNLALPHTPQALRFLWMPICVLVCIAAAYVLFRLVEKPSSERSQKIPLSERQASRRARREQSGLAAAMDSGVQPLPPI